MEVGDGSNPNKLPSADELRETLTIPDSMLTEIAQAIPGQLQEIRNRHKEDRNQHGLIVAVAFSRGKASSIVPIWVDRNERNPNNPFLMYAMREPFQHALQEMDGREGSGLIPVAIANTSFGWPDVKPVFDLTHRRPVLPDTGDLISWAQWGGQAIPPMYRRDDQPIQWLTEMRPMMVNVVGDHGLCIAQTSLTGFEPTSAADEETLLEKARKTRTPAGPLARELARTGDEHGFTYAAIPLSDIGPLEQLALSVLPQHIELIGQRIQPSRPNLSFLDSE